MHVVTWNVNGLRSLLREYGNLDSIFQTLDADVLCFQESRLGTDDITLSLIPDGYDAFLSSCAHNKGYAGVVTYVRQTYLPVAAYTTLTDLLESTLLLNSNKIYNKYSDDFIQDCNEEGRIVVLVYDNAILMNIYFPANTEEKREDFRKDFYNLIKDIVLQMDRTQYSLFLLGDFNTACGIIDSAYLENDHEKNGFIEQFRSMSEWLESIQLPFEEKGCNLIDTFRIIHPSKRNAYTCFCNQFGGRVTNFGSRIDYIFCDRNLLDTIQDAMILTEVKGSDHIPMKTSFNFELISTNKCSGIRTFVKQQHRIDHFFSKQYKEKEVKPSVNTTHEPTEVSETEWACDRCTFVNSIKQEYCEMCGSRKQKRQRATVDIGIDSLFGKRRKSIRVPLCSGHHIPCCRRQGDSINEQLYVVSKEGKNKGRFFYISF